MGFLLEILPIKISSHEKCFENILKILFIFYFYGKAVKVKIGEVFIEDEKYFVVENQQKLKG